MHRADIRAALQKKGLTLSQVSREAGLSSSACGYALLFPSRRAEAAITAALNVNPYSLWPDRYDVTGHRRIRFNRTAVSADGSARHARGGQ